LRLEERLRALPGVHSVGMAVVGVLQNNEWDNWVTIEGYQAKPGEVPDPHVNYISAGYLEALHIPVLAGRSFTPNDVANSPKVALVNAKFAKKYFGDSPAVGRRFGMGSDPTTKIDTEIVGVVQDTRYENLRSEIPEEVYFCYQQYSNVGVTMYVRTAQRPESAFGTIRATVRDVDANLPIMSMKTLDSQLEESIVTERMIATLSSAFGVLATVLAVIGLYGVMAYMVTRRSREIGIRMALGAQSGNVVWLVMREVLALVGIGIALGLPAAYALTRLVKAQLYDVQPNDMLSMAGATALLAFVAVLAGYIPARRAAGYDPVRVLRYD
jgi:predicted permease